MKLIKGDCLEVLKQLEDNSVDMVLTDPALWDDSMQMGHGYSV
jgi:DNA modification methylase